MAFPRLLDKTGVTGLSPAPQEIRPPPPLKRGAIFLGLSPPGGEYPRNIAPLKEIRTPSPPINFEFLILKSIEKCDSFIY